VTASQRLREAVRAVLLRERAHRGLVVAVSGGPDSVALLRAIHEMRPAGTLPNLIVAHLNHQLRGAESDADESFVANLAGQLNVCFVRTALDVRRAAEGENLEATARRLRYAWLGEVAHAAGVDLIATGHTASDQAETVLLRLLRGAGFQGLRGIAGERQLEAGLRVLRPLRTITRSEVLAYLEDIGQGARHDTSNDDQTLTRNRIRHQLLPLLEADYNPAIARVLVRLADQAEEFFAEEEASAGELLRRAERPRAGSLVVLERAALRTEPRSHLRSLFRAIYRREDWPVDAMPFALWDQMAGAVVGEAVALDLPAGIRLRVLEHVIQLGQTG
jgi:tRNA(Ile)-lysidine synthase